MDCLTPVPRSSYKCARSTSRGQSVRMPAVKFCTMYHLFARMQIGSVQTLRLNAGQRHLVVKVQYLTFFLADFYQRNNQFGADLWVYYALSRGQVIRTETGPILQYTSKQETTSSFLPKVTSLFCIGSPFQKPGPVIPVLLCSST